MTATGEGSAVELPLPSEEYMRLVSGGGPDDLEAHFEWVGGVLAAMLKNAEMLEPGSRLLDIGLRLRPGRPSSPRRAARGILPASTATRG